MVSTNSHIAFDTDTRKTRARSASKQVAPAKGNSVSGGQSDAESERKWVNTADSAVKAVEETKTEEKAAEEVTKIEVEKAAEEVPKIEVEKAAEEKTKIEVEKAAEEKTKIEVEKAAEEKTKIEVEKAAEEKDSSNRWMNNRGGCRKQFKMEKAVERGEMSAYGRAKAGRELMQDKKVNIGKIVDGEAGLVDVEFKKELRKYSADDSEKENVAGGGKSQNYSVNTSKPTVEEIARMWYVQLKKQNANLDRLEMKAHYNRWVGNMKEAPMFNAIWTCLERTSETKIAKTGDPAQSGFSRSDVLKRLLKRMCKEGLPSELPIDSQVFARRLAEISGFSPLTPFNSKEIMRQAYKNNLVDVVERDDKVLITGVKWPYKVVREDRKSAGVDEKDIGKKRRARDVQTTHPREIVRRKLEKREVERKMETRAEKIAEKRKLERKMETRAEKIAEKRRVERKMETRAEKIAEKRKVEKIEEKRKAAKMELERLRRKKRTEKVAQAEKQKLVPVGDTEVKAKKHQNCKRDRTLTPELRPAKRYREAEAVVKQRLERKRAAKAKVTADGKKRCIAHASHDGKRQKTLAPKARSQRERCIILSSSSSSLSSSSPSSSSSSTSTL